MIKSLFSRLMDYTPGTTEIVPSLAESLTVSPDGLTYTFKLNPQGQVLQRPRGSRRPTSNIRSSARSIPRPRGPAPASSARSSARTRWRAGTATTISGIETPDDDTVMFKLTPARRDLPPCAGDQLLLRRAQGSRRGGRRRFRQEAGRLGRVQAGGMGDRPAPRLLTQPRFYFRDRPKLDGFTVEIGQEPLVAILRLQKGEVDIAGDGIPPAKYPGNQELARRARTSSSMASSSRPAI